MRRLPIFFLLDCSDSMAGTRIEQMEAVLKAVIRTLRTDPTALEQVHISVIAFAGIARVVVPLIDLVSFYPPKLPLGSGTHLGEAFSLLMQEIDKQVQVATPERKGDWKPIVYVLTDGRPTDNMQPVLQRWQAYRTRVQLVAVGLGDDPDYAILQQLTDQVLAFSGKTEEDFSRFIRWMSQSVQAFSQSVGFNNTLERQPTPNQGGISLVKPDAKPTTHSELSLDKNAPAAKEDEQCVTLTGRCSATRRPYLIRYERVQRSDLPDVLRKYQPGGVYQLDNAYRLEEDYFLWSDPAGYMGSKVQANDLLGTPPCPQCGNACSFAVCRCGGLLCIGGTNVAVKCPWCAREIWFEAGDDDADFSVTRSQG